MPYVVNLGYPSAAGARFELDYYLKKHMPMVERIWSKDGLQHWQIVQYKEADAPYGVQAILTFRDRASWIKASTENGEEVFGDIPNFTDLKPAVYHGEQVGTQS